ncbi:MAG: LysE family transporter [Prevotellaceae bacterium]|nr:LysE family transporter [Candidatus Faecinaster equi]
MFEIEPISTFELILKGIFIGIIVSAPMGPVGILCIRRALKKGFKYGIATGLGAATSDLIYALMTGLGMSFVMEFIHKKENLFVLQLSGSIMLLIFGLYMFKNKPSNNFRSVTSKEKGTLLHNAVTSFLVTFSNPLIIFLFIALFARFAFVVPNHPIPMVAGFAAIYGGAMLWWFLLSYIIDHIRQKFSDKYIKIFNIIIGSIVVIASLYGFATTILGLSLIE